MPLTSKYFPYQAFQYSQKIATNKTGIIKRVGLEVIYQNRQVQLTVLLHTT
jgi:hypothetical protein